MAGFFADECVALEIVEILRDAGADVVYAKEVCRGARDREVLRLASEAGRILITDDTGFGELAVRQGLPAVGVAILSLYQLPAGDREQYAARQILAIGDGFRGRLSIIEPGRVRSRPLPDPSFP